MFRQTPIEIYSIAYSLNFFPGFVNLKSEIRNQKIMNNRQFYLNNGYLHLKNFLDKNLVDNILTESKSVFLRQFVRMGYTDVTSVKDISTAVFDEMMYRLFEDDFSVLSNCGKQVQHLISLHKLSLCDEILALLNEIGMDFPNISTRPLLFFNHPRLSKEKLYYKVDAHQDWRSMQGSLNSVVVWVPLMNVPKELGALEILPKSHLNGLMTSHFDRGFGMVDLTDQQNEEFLSVEVELGDILLFSSFLIHQSGDNVSDTPRWSCHFRYNDLGDTSFVDRGYPHAYIYKPIEELITPDFPSIEDLNYIFKLNIDNSSSETVL